MFLKRCSLYFFFAFVFLSFVQAFLVTLRVLDAEVVNVCLNTLFVMLSLTAWMEAMRIKRSANKVTIRRRAQNAHHHHHSCLSLSLPLISFQTWEPFSPRVSGKRIITLNNDLEENSQFYGPLFVFSTLSSLSFSLSCLSAAKSCPKGTFQCGNNKCRSTAILVRK